MSSIISAAQYPDGLWVETVPESAGVGLDAPVPPAWQQECLVWKAGVAVIREDPLGLPPPSFYTGVESIDTQVPVTKLEHHENVDPLQQLH